MFYYPFIETIFVNTTAIDLFKMISSTSLFFSLLLGYLHEVGHYIQKNKKMYFWQHEKFQRREMGLYFKSLIENNADYLSGYLFKRLENKEIIPYGYSCEGNNYFFHMGEYGEKVKNQANDKQQTGELILDCFGSPIPFKKAINVHGNGETRMGHFSQGYKANYNNIEKSLLENTNNNEFIFNMLKWTENS